VPRKSQTGSATYGSRPFDPIRDGADTAWQSRGRRFDPVQLHHFSFLLIASCPAFGPVWSRSGSLWTTRSMFDSYNAAHYEEAARFEAPVPALWGPMSFVTVFRRYH